MNKPFAFDPITGDLEDFISLNQSLILSIEAKLVEKAFHPTVKHQGHQLTGSAAHNVLWDCFDLTVEIFRQIAATQGIDIWMTLLRRFPPRSGRSRDWETYLSMALIAHANLNESSAFSNRTTTNGYMHAYSIDFETLLNAFKLDILAAFLSGIVISNRWVGKGAIFSPTPRDPLRFHANKRVINSVKHYERRRQFSNLFADEGLAGVRSVNNGNPVALLIFGKNTSYRRLYDPQKDRHLLLHYTPLIIDIRIIEKSLRLYSEPIEDIFDISVDAILHALSALTYRTRLTFLDITSVGMDYKICESSLGDEEYAKKLKFMFDLMQKGLLFFDKMTWLSHLRCVTSPWADTEEKSETLVSEFLEAFSIRHSRPMNIDLRILHPVPFVFESSAGTIYIDLTITLDFLAYVINRAKSWFSTQHGDQFTLAVKRSIEDETSAKVLFWKHKFNYGKETREVDLVVYIGQRLYVIECKAYAKSRKMFRGDGDAIRLRDLQIKRAHAQASAAVEIVRRLLDAGHFDEYSIHSIAAVVCTPAQEYLDPINKYGMLSTNIPAVCTHEELIRLLQGKGD